LDNPPFGVHFSFQGGKRHSGKTEAHIFKVISWSARDRSLSEQCRQRVTWWEGLAIRVAMNENDVENQA
jgi:hypothetical protein